MYSSQVVVGKPGDRHGHLRVRLRKDSGVSTFIFVYNAYCLSHNVMSLKALHLVSPAKSIYQIRKYVYWTHKKLFAVHKQVSRCHRPGDFWTSVSQFSIQAFSLVLSQRAACRSPVCYFPHAHPSFLGPLLFSL